MVTLFELYGYDNEKVNSGEVRKEILQNWTDVEKNDITKNLCVPIGKNEHGALNLDLYEKAVSVRICLWREPPDSGKSGSDYYLSDRPLHEVLTNGPESDAGGYERRRLL